MSKYGELIQQARKQENQQIGKRDSQTVGQPDNHTGTAALIQATPKPEVEVNLCVKVPVSLRRHWSAEAKRQGTTMTAVIMQALEAKFGRPD